jgi:hypothetical protein
MQYMRTSFVATGWTYSKDTEMQEMHPPFTSSGLGAAAVDSALSSRESSSARISILSANSSFRRSNATSSSISIISPNIRADGFPHPPRPTAVKAQSNKHSTVSFSDRAITINGHPLHDDSSSSGSSNGNITSISRSNVQFSDSNSTHVADAEQCGLDIEESSEATSSSSQSSDEAAAAVNSNSTELAPTATVTSTSHEPEILP